MSPNRLLSSAVLTAAALNACDSRLRTQMRQRLGHETVDSVQAARLAIAAVGDTSDTLIFYHVATFSRDNNGYVISVLPQIRPQFAAPRPDGSQLEIVGGGGKILVRRDGTVTVLERYR